MFCVTSLNTKYFQNTPSGAIAKHKRQQVIDKQPDWCQSTKLLLNEFQYHYGKLKAVDELFLIFIKATHMFDLHNFTLFCFHCHTYQTTSTPLSHTPTLMHTHKVSLLNAHRFLGCTFFASTIHSRNELSVLRTCSWLGRMVRRRLHINKSSITTKWKKIYISSFKKNENLFLCGY